MRGYLKKQNHNQTQAKKYQTEQNKTRYIVGAFLALSFSGALWSFIPLDTLLISKINAFSVHSALCQEGVLIVIGRVT